MDDARRSGHPQPLPRGEIRALTGLRIVAALWVVLLHFDRFTGPYLDQVPAFRSVVNAGAIGVELFFVLSGFLICLAYVDKLGTRPAPGAAARFVWNRVARIWPAWAVVTLAMGAWVWGLRRFGWDADLVVPHPPADLGHLAEQLTMTQMWGAPGFLGASYVLPGWSISAEWAAYLAFPLLALLVRPLRRLHPAVLMALSVLAMAPLSVESFLHGTPDGATPWSLRIACGFTAGVLAALAVRGMSRTRVVEAGARAASILALVGIVLIALWASWRRAGDPMVNYCATAVWLFPVLIASLSLTDRGPARLLASAPMVYGGRISYCVYLVHYVVLDVALTVAWQAPEGRWVLSPGLALAMPALVLLSVALAAVLYHLVEEPGRRLLMRAVPQRRAAATPAASPAPDGPAMARPPATVLTPTGRPATHPGLRAAVLRREADPEPGAGTERLHPVVVPAGWSGPPAPAGADRMPAPRPRAAGA
ncbi:acyltransferase family protein [Geodermatophilus sp. SYSU D01106]